ncbi:hypothetical protein [Micromonospora coerulea]
MTSKVPLGSGRGTLRDIKPQPGQAAVQLADRRGLVGFSAIVR